MANKPDLRKVENNKVYMISAPSQEMATKIMHTIDKVENISVQLLDVIQKEADDLIRSASVIPTNEEGDVREPTWEEMKMLILKKDSLAKTLLIQLRLEQFSGLKRGILPRVAGTGSKPPERDYAAAQRMVEDYNYRKELERAGGDITDIQV